MKHNFPPFNKERPKVAEKEIMKGRPDLTGGPETIDDGSPKKAPLLQETKND